MAYPSKGSSILKFVSMATKLLWRRRIRRYHSLWTTLDQTTLSIPRPLMRSYQATIWRWVRRGCGLGWSERLVTQGDLCYYCVVSPEDKGFFKRFQHLPNIRATKLNGWWANVGWTEVSTSFNIFKNKENVEAMLNGSLNQFKLDSTHFQHFSTLSTMLNDLFKRPRHLVQQLCWTYIEANVEIL